MQNGSNKTQNYVQIVKCQFKKMLDATILHVLDVNMNFVGFAQEIGNLIKEQITNAIKLTLFI